MPKSYYPCFLNVLRYRDGAETEQHFLHRTINGLQISSERQSNRCQQVGMEIVTDPRAARQYVLWCLHAEGMIERWLIKGRSETSHVLRLYKININAVSRALFQWSGGDANRFFFFLLGLMVLQVLI